ncbi:hypothetical protein L083_1120 [Actinoplanes sp. N902-109]|nr:hypothetical protein L083_1120 [Actinoplanes sp. N902-109]
MRDLSTSVKRRVNPIFLDFVKEVLPVTIAVRGNGTCQDP